MFKVLLSLVVLQTFQFNEDYQFEKSNLNKEFYNLILERIWNLRPFYKD